MSHVQCVVSISKRVKVSTRGPQGDSMSGDAVDPAQVTFSRPTPQLLERKRLLFAEMGSALAPALSRRELQNLGLCPSPRGALGQ